MRILIPAVVLFISLLGSAAMLSADETPDSWAAAMSGTRDRLLQEGGSVQLTDAQLWSMLKRFWETYPETDWFLQDQPHRPVDATSVDPHRDWGWYFRADRESVSEQALVRRVLGELGADAEDLTRRLNSLIAGNTPPGAVAWLELYSEACHRRRTRRLRSLAARVPRIVFTQHYTMGGSHYAYTEGQSDAQAERHFYPGAALCLLTWDGNEYRQRTLIDDPNGVIRDPSVSHDGNRLLFSWKKSDRDDDYHLYEMDVATQQVRQLTFGLGVADYEGIYLPDGDILFNSTRCVQTVDCWWTEVSNLYRCDKDGEQLRRLTFDQVHDNFPTVTPDGRILYTRWEYNDRGQIYPQPLLQMNPDGTQQREFYGVNSWFPTTILHARGVPGSSRVLAIASGHHTRQTGKLIEIDPAQGRQENAGVTLVAPPRATPGRRIDAYGQEGELFQYPYPLDESTFLVAYHPIGWPWARGKLGPLFGVYWMNRHGARERLAIDPRLPCNQPIPLSARHLERTRPSQVDYGQTEGTCYIQDVYAGPGLAGVPRGTVTRIRVVALEFRAAGIGENRNGGPGGGALISTPIAIGNGAWDPKTIIGDAAVHQDGSSFFPVPARRPIYFQLLDDAGRMVQSMRSWTSLQPGENASCVGCHEHKNSAPPLLRQPLTMALRHGPESLTPFYGPERGFSFTREVQPVLDQHCISCHNADEEVPYDLTSERVSDRQAKRLWTRSYLELTHAQPDRTPASSAWRGNPDHPLVNWISSQSAPPMLAPRSAGAVTSRLMSLLMAGHEGVKLSRDELDKLQAWIDLGVPFCGDYVEANDWNDQERSKYEHFSQKRRQLRDAEHW